MAVISLHWVSLDWVLALSLDWVFPSLGSLDWVPVPTLSLDWVPALSLDWVFPSLGVP